MRVFGPDIYFEHEPAPAALHDASEAAFGVPGDAVVVTRMLSDTASHAAQRDDARVIWIRETDDQPGEFPGHFLLQVPSGMAGNLEGPLQHIARTLRLAFVTTADDDEPGDIVLYDADGTRVAVTADLRADEDYAIRLPAPLAAQRRERVRTTTITTG